MNIKIEPTFTNNPAAGFSIINEITPTEGQILGFVQPNGVRVEPVNRFVEHYNALVKVAEAAKLLAKRVSDRHEDEKSDWTENDFSLYLKVTEALVVLKKP